MTSEQFDKAYRDVWSSFPSANRLWRFAQAITAIERAECAKVCEARYMGDNNREDAEAKRCAAAIRARSEA